MLNATQLQSIQHTTNQFFEYFMQSTAFSLSEKICYVEHALTFEPETFNEFIRYLSCLSSPDAIDEEYKDFLSALETINWLHYNCTVICSETNKTMKACDVLFDDLSSIDEVDSQAFKTAFNEMMVSQLTRIRAEHEAEISSEIQINNFYKPIASDLLSIFSMINRITLEAQWSDAGILNGAEFFQNTQLLQAVIHRECVQLLRDQAIARENFSPESRISFYQNVIEQIYKRFQMRLNIHNMSMTTMLYFARFIVSFASVIKPTDFFQLDPAIQKDFFMNTGPMLAELVTHGVISLEEILALTPSKRHILSNAGPSDVKSLLSDFGHLFKLTDLLALDDYYIDFLLKIDEHAWNDLLIQKSIPFQTIVQLPFQQLKDVFNNPNDPDVLEILSSPRLLADTVALAVQDRVKRATEPDALCMMLSAGWMTLERMSDHDTKQIKIILQELQHAGLLIEASAPINGNKILAWVNRSRIDQLRRAVIVLQKYSLLTQANLLTQSNFDLIMSVADSPEVVAQGLHELNKIGLLNETNRYQLTQHSVRKIQIINTLLNENRQSLFDGSGAQTNFDFLIRLSFHGLHNLTGLLKLIKHIDQFDRRCARVAQVNFNYIIQHHEILLSHVYLNDLNGDHARHSHCLESVEAFTLEHWVEILAICFRFQSNPEQGKIKLLDYMDLIQQAYDAHDCQANLPSLQAIASATILSSTSQTQSIFNFWRLSRPHEDWPAEQIGLFL